ncbi:integral ER membrane protein Scs2, putative [Aspergillus fumigatus A1163]|uniref:Integral ER membrane protein Scs2, putative n=1 Tax=Aspergillus fumigatus (strain CBS 144.89 / FGSC A1163 / CEA10) TaxID=451804 RepID=B0Y5N6_ASPFC|nr:integral ER membrane protein Scs2, putative [Aspergillus fumigatus A1163]
MWMSKVDPYLEASAQPLMGVLISRTVLLQAMKEEPAPDAKCKDKFLVQTVAVTGDMEFSNVSSISPQKASRGRIRMELVHLKKNPLPIRHLARTIKLLQLGLPPNFPMTRHLSHRQISARSPSGMLSPNSRMRLQPHLSNRTHRVSQLQLMS